MIEKKFAFHTPSESGKIKVDTLRIAFSTLDKLIKDTAPPSRELSLALTELENAAMWAIKAVVLNDSASVAHE